MVHRVLGGREKVSQALVGTITQARPWDDVSSWHGSSQIFDGIQKLRSHRGCVVHVHLIIVIACENIAARDQSPMTSTSMSRLYNRG